MCSGWLKMVHGLDPTHTINIHPGPLPEFGGYGMHGHFVHEAVMETFRKGRITQSAVTLHFVNEEYDQGPIIAMIPVLIRPEDTAETLGARVNKVEHAWQSYYLNEIVHGRIRLEKGRVKYLFSDLERFSAKNFSK